MDSEKIYQSHIIPSRNQSSENNSQDETICAIHNDEPFAEIEIKQLSNNRTKIGEQILENQWDEKRALFYEMRSIAWNDPAYYWDESKIFYKQAMFMKDFEDDYQEKKEFTTYYPHYQRMGYEQLRTYFTWRTQVRKGIIANTSVAYAFIYIYELLNNVGVTNPQDGLDKLMIFWNAFRVYNTVIDRYMLLWLKDYHVYYPLVQSFCEFANENGLKTYYPTTFGYKSVKEDSFEIYANISSYKIKESLFFNEQNRDLVINCFNFVLTHLRTSFENKNRCFDDLVFFANETIWIPFRNALFYSVSNQEDRQVVISDMEVYTLKKDFWDFTTLILLKSGKHFVGYIMKKMEVELRKIVKFKNRLSANISMCGNMILKRIESVGLTLPDAITEWVMKFYKEYSIKPVLINIDNLKQIRSESLQIQEKLIIQDDLLIQTEKINKPIAMASKKQNLDVWTEFKMQLAQIEKEALKIILNNNDIKAFAMENNTMLEVLIDGINQKAIDCICDTILELDNTIMIYEEYRERLIEMVK